MPKQKQKRIKRGSIVRNTETGELMLLLCDVKCYAQFIWHRAVWFWHIPAYSALRAGGMKRSSLINFEKLKIVIEGCGTVKKRRN